MKRHLAAALMLCFGATTSASAQSAGARSAGPIKLDVPPVISKMVERGRGVVIVDSFPVADTSLTAWVLAAAGETRIYYVTPDQRHVIYGLLFDRDLANVTARQINAYPMVSPTPAVAKVPESKAEAAPTFESGPTVQAALAEARAAKPTLVEGKGRDVYVVYDAGCPSCGRLWLQTRTSLGTARIHWIPVATATRHGAGLAQAIFDSRNPAETMHRAATRTLKPSESVSSAVASDLARNARVLEVAGKRNVPFLLFEDGGKAASHLGVPRPPHISYIFGDSASAAKRQ